ncbi:MAG: M24 family metallopeptidase [Ilumatobacteraceae bacterium]
MSAIVDEGTRSRELLDAQARAAELFTAVTTSGIVRADVTDKEASRAITDLAAERFGVRKHWHKRIVRSGPNTLLPYQENPPDRTIGDDDIVFADFGPIFDGWEADFGRTWVLGDDPVKHRLCADLQTVFDAGKRFFAEHPDLTGEQLYGHVVGLAEQAGWTYGNWHCGHLVGEFPHENFDGEQIGSVIATGSTLPMRRLDPSGRVGHWILEIRLTDPDRQIGGFFEELLTL